MARGTGPLFSLEATGSIGDALTYGKRGRANVIKRKSQPANPRTIAQIQARAAIAAASELWRLATDADKESWAELAAQREITKFNAFTSYIRQGLLNGQGPRLNLTTGTGPDTLGFNLTDLAQYGNNIRLDYEWGVGGTEGQTFLITGKPDVGGSTPASEHTVVVHYVTALDEAVAFAHDYINDLPDGDYRLGIISVGTDGSLGEHANFGLFTKPL